MDQYGVEDTVFCEVDITIFYNFIRTTKFAHMNGHWKDYDISQNPMNSDPKCGTSCRDPLLKCQKCDKFVFEPQNEVYTWGK